MHSSFKIRHSFFLPLHFLLSSFLLTGCAHAGSKMLMLDQQTKRADIPFTSLREADKPIWLGKLAYDPGYFKIVAHTYVLKGAEGEMYCGLTGDAWVKEQGSILITATAQGIDSIASPVEVPIYTRDTTNANPVCTGSELSVADVMPFTPMKDSDDFGAIRIAFKYSDNKKENLSSLATQTISVMQAFTPIAAAAAITTPLTSNAMQSLSTSYGKIAGAAATDWVTLPIDYKALREGIDAWSVTVQLAERGIGSSFTDIINNPEKYKKKIRPVLRIDFKVVYSPSVFTREVEAREVERRGEEYFPRIDPADKSIIAPAANAPVNQPSLLQRLNSDSPSPLVKLAREASGAGSIQTACDDIRKIIDAAPLTLLDRAIWYNAALMQVNDNWGTDPKFMKSSCVTAGARDYATVLDNWFPGLVNIIKLSDVEYARYSSRAFTNATQKLFPDFAHALLQTQNSPQQADVEFRNLFDDNIVLHPMSSLFADNLMDRKGVADVSAALSTLKVKSAGCFYQMPFQVGLNEGFLALTLDEQIYAQRALVKYTGGKITEIALQDINTPSYKNEVIAPEWRNQSTCKTQIIPALQAMPATIAARVRPPTQTQVSVGDTNRAAAPVNNTAPAGTAALSAASAPAISNTPANTSINTVDHSAANAPANAMTTNDTAETDHNANEKDRDAAMPASAATSTSAVTQ